MLLKSFEEAVSACHFVKFVLLHDVISEVDHGSEEGWLVGASRIDGADAVGPKLCDLLSSGG